MSEDEAAPKRKKIWAYALIAIWIAVIAAAVMASLDPSRGPQPNGDPGRSGEIITFVLGYAFAAAALASLVIWLAFYAMFFRTRASLSKSLGVLVIMLLASTAVAAPSRFVAMGLRVNERTVVIDSWSQLTADHVRALQTKLDGDRNALGDLTFARLIAPEDIDDILARNERVVALQEKYSADLNLEFEDAYERGKWLGLNDEERSELMAQYEDRIFKRLRHDADLNLQAACQRLAMVVLLHDAKAKWTIQDGHLAFRDAALLQRLNAMGEDYDRLAREINANNPDVRRPVDGD